MVPKIRSCRSAIVQLLTMVLLVCGVMAGQDIKTNFMPGVDFAKYKTFKWAQVDNSEIPDQIVAQQIQNAVEAQLSAKGFTKTEGANADMYVTMQTAIQQQRQWNAWGSGGVRFGGMGSATSSTLEIGTLAVDFYDASNKQLIWRGLATKTLNPSKNADTNLKRINQGVEKLLKNFPPKP